MPTFYRIFNPIKI